MINTNDDNGEIIKQIKKDDSGNIIYKEKDFLFIGDAIDYIKEHLVANQRIYVYGQSEINQYISKHDGKLKTNIVRKIQQIRVARADEENQAVEQLISTLKKKGLTNQNSIKKRNIIFKDIEHIRMMTRLSFQFL
jgi:hypothetical protein